MKTKLLCAALFLAPSLAAAAPTGFGDLSIEIGSVSRAGLGSVDSKLATSVDPQLAVTTDPDFNGVGSLFIGGGFCTATLVNSRQAVTAAHCFGDGAGDGSMTGITTTGGVLGLGSSSVSGNTVFFDDVIGISNVAINPLWLGPTGGVDVLGDGTIVSDVFGDGDIAVITLDREATGFNTYDILLEQTFEELFAPHIRVGRGTSSPLSDPSDVTVDFQARVGVNEYDLFLSNIIALDTVVPGSRLLYDCDSGDSADNFLPSFSTAAPGQTFGPGSLGFGSLESCAVGGDSGGGNFLVGADGELILAGVTSFGSDPQRFGGFGGDTRTAAHADFLLSSLFRTGGGGVNEVPAPAPLTLLLAGLFGLGFARRRG